MTPAEIGLIAYVEQKYFQPVFGFFEKIPRKNRRRLENSLARILRVLIFLPVPPVRNERLREKPDNHQDYQCESDNINFVLVLFVLHNLHYLSSLPTNFL